MLEGIVIGVSVIFVCLLVAFMAGESPPPGYGYDDDPWWKPWGKKWWKD